MVEFNNYCYVSVSDLFCIGFMTELSSNTANELGINSGVMELQ